VVWCIINMKILIAALIIWKLHCLHQFALLFLSFLTIIFLHFTVCYCHQLLMCITAQWWCLMSPLIICICVLMRKTQDTKNTGTHSSKYCSTSDQKLLRVPLICGNILQQRWNVIIAFLTFIWQTHLSKVTYNECVSMCTSILVRCYVVVLF